MPELPEVETVARELRKTILNKKIRFIEPVWHKSFDNRSDDRYKNQPVESITRKGKFLILKLSKSFLIFHLRMTGQILYTNGKSDLNNYTRAIIHLDEGKLLFIDIRKFGRIYHVENSDDFLSHIGIDALDNKVTKDLFFEMVKSSKMNIKAFLMSQKHISGMGNIYTDEVLFLSKINPAKITATISRRKINILFDNIRHVLQQSINNMGSTISDYRDPAGNKGKNQYYFNVYDREGKECKVCGTIIRKIKWSGRGTHFCPVCQKA